jgi:uncharacterized RmlC-like cupin family protein
MVDAATTGSRELFVFELTLAPGESLPLHRHHRDDELIFIHTGEARTQVGELSRRAGAGTTLYIPAGTPVGMVNRSVVPVKALVVFAAPHMADYIRSLGTTPGQPRRNLSPAELEKIRSRHYVTFP